MRASRRTDRFWYGFVAVSAAAVVAYVVAAATAHAQTAGGSPADRRATTHPSTAPTTTATSQPDENTADGLVELGRRAAELKKYDEAMGYYRRAVDKDPRDVAALAGMASISAKQNKMSDCVRYYVQAGQAGIAAKRYTIAEQLLQEAAGVDPGNPQVCFLLAQTFAATEREPLAIEMYRRYLKTEQNDYRGYLAVGKLYLSSKYYRQAIGSLRRAESLNSQDSETLATLAKAYRAVKDYSQAEEVAARPVRSLELLLQSDANLSSVPDAAMDYYVTYAGILLDADKLDEAERQARRGIEVCRRKLQLAPDDLQLLYGMVHLDQTLSLVVQKRLSRDSKNGALLASHARLMVELAELNEAIDLHLAADTWAEAAQYAPDDLNTLQELATVQYKVKRMSAAAETCRKILKLKPDDAFAKSLLTQIGPATTRGAAATQPTTQP